MRIGIRPINDFAFKKVFGTIANKLALISSEHARSMAILVFACT